MAEVVKLELVSVGEGFRFDPEELLEAAKGQGFESLVIMGETADGMYLSGSANAGETLILLERAKHALVFGDD